jgi:NADH-quinone oxidoreductase subunit L
MVAAGVYLVGRAYPLFHASETTMGVIATVGTFTAFFAASIALVQRDIKRILAYSTVSQLGYMIMALGIGAYTAGLFHLFTHAFFKALLFLGAGSVIHSMEPVLHASGRNPNDIFNMGGLRKKMPVTFWTFLIASLSLAGIPPLAGFWSKDAILLGAWEEGAYLPLAVALLTASLTAFYMFRCIYLTFFGEPRWGSDDHLEAHASHPEPNADGHGAHPTPHESPAAMALPLLLIAVPAIGAGWLGMPGIYAPFEEAVRFGPIVEEHLNVWLAVAGSLAGLLGIGLATLMYLRPVIGPRLLGDAFPDTYRFLLNKYYFDEMYQWLIDRVVLATAALAATLDRKVVNDTFTDAPGPILSTLGEWLRRSATGRVQHYAVGFVLGIAIVGAVVAGFVPDLHVDLW